MTAEKRQSIRQRIQAQFRFVPTRQHVHQRDDELDDDEMGVEEDAPDLRSVGKDDPTGKLPCEKRRVAPNDNLHSRRCGPQIAEQHSVSILRDYLAGQPGADIARRLRVSDEIVWRILDKNLTPEQKRQRRQMARRKSQFCTAVFCVERPELVFACVQDAAAYIGRTRSAVVYALDEPGRKCGGYHWRRVTKATESREAAA